MIQNYLCLTFKNFTVPYTWKILENKDELEPNAVSFGSGLYVGGASFDSIYSLSVIDENGQCSKFNDERTGSGCVYLFNEPGSFEWIPSQNGVVEVGAVKFNNFAIGRIPSRDGKFAIGKIEQGFLFYGIGDKVLKAANYFALVYTPLRDAAL